MEPRDPPRAEGVPRPLLIFRETEALIVDALEEAGIGFVWSDGERLLHANDAACRMLSLSREALRALPDPFLLLSEEQREQLREAMQKRLAGENVPSAVEAPVIRPDGSRLMLRVFVRSVPREGARPEVIAVVRDAAEMDARLARSTTRQFVQAVFGPDGWRHAEIEAAGARFGRAVAPTSVDEGLVHFERLGVGELAHDASADGAHRFSGIGLAEARKGTEGLGCALALGFLVGVVEAVSGRLAVGAHVECEARGDARCRFVVKDRRAGP